MGQMAAQVGVLSLVLLSVFCGSVKALGEGSEGPKTRFSGHSLHIYIFIYKCGGRVYLGIKCSILW